MLVSTVEDKLAARAALAERLRPRIAVEHHFAQLGHTYRHGKAFRFFDHQIMRPALTLGLKSLGLFSVGRRNSLDLQVRRFTLHYPDLPAAFHGFQLLHLSDFHIDGVDGLADALAIRLRELRPDLCLFTGDYRFEDRGPAEAVYPRMRQVIQAISSKHGILAILGNHDDAQIAFGMEELGVRMLVNENVEIRQGSESLWIAGVDDPFDYRCDDLKAALAGVPRSGFKILLAHAPEIFQSAAQSGVHLYLSGHTHAGQIRLPFIGSIKHNSHCPKEFSYGLWQYQQMRGYTSPGVGCSSVPVRFHCPPEIVLFELKRSGKTFEQA